MLKYGPGECARQAIEQCQRPYETMLKRHTLTECAIHYTLAGFRQAVQCPVMSCCEQAAIWRGRPTDCVEEMAEGKGKR